MVTAVNLRLNHVLCFLFTKLNKCDVKYIRQSLLDYYTAEDIHEAKEVLLSTVSTLSDTECLSKIRARQWVHGA